MVTRRTTLRSRTGTKLYAVRDSSGKFKDIQSYKRAHAADLRRKSAAEIGMKTDELEKQLVRAKKGAAKLAVRAQEQIGMRTDELEKQLTRAKKGAGKLAVRAQEQATAATKVVRRSMKEAVVALKRATNKAARRVMEATAPAKPMKATRRHAAG